MAWWFIGIEFPFDQVDAISLSWELGLTPANSVSTQSRSASFT